MTWREKNFQRAMPKEPSRIFVNSMSEIAYWKPEWWERVIDRIRQWPSHSFLFLTKSPAIYREHSLPDNCWCGVTVTNQADIDRRLPFDCGSNLAFVSFEPMLGKVDPDSLCGHGLSWVILAAETGNRKERVIPPPEWIAPFLDLPIPLYMKHNLPWAGKWRKEFPL
jgi:protein gp37